MRMTRVTRELDAVPEMEWVRLAAFIDGEGCITIQRHLLKTSKTVRDPSHRAVSLFAELIIANTDPRLPDWLMRVFGGNIQHSRKNNGKWKSQYHWRVSCAYGCEIIRRAMPFLLLKKEQAQVALALQRTMKRVGVKGHSVEVMAEKERLKVRMHELNARGPAVVADLIN